MSQSRSGCWFPRGPAPRRGRRSRFWGCRATSSRSAIPIRYCLARFSRFVRKFHRCPGLRDDPAGFLRFVEKLLAARHFDVLLPTHEQGFLFARVRQRLDGPCRAGAAGFRELPHRAQQGRLQPAARSTGLAAAGNADRDIRQANCATRSGFPASSRPRWAPPAAASGSCATTAISNAALQDLGASGAFADEVLVQDLVAGATEKAQAVFCRGELIGFHAYRQIAAGAGGGEAIKQSVQPARAARACSRRSERRLAWHGALSVDYIVP